MILNQICTRLKFIILSIFGTLKRGLCCFSRRRKPSLSECEELESINVIGDYSTEKKSERERDWNCWDDGPRTVEEHIEQYRQNLVRPPSPKTPVPETDFFQDMAPKIKPPPKIYIGSEAEPKTDFSRLEAKIDIPIAIVNELEDWNEDDAIGWEECNDEQTKMLIREKRRELRAQRQLNKTREISNKVPHNFAERIANR